MRVPRDTSKRLKHYARDMRRELTDAERKLWEHLRKHRLEGYRFRRQHPVGGFIVDFYCVPARLAIELDGGQHLEPEAVKYDEARTAKLGSLGVRVLRFSDVDVLKDTGVVVEEVYRALTEGPPPQPSPGVPEEGVGGSRESDLLFVYGTLIPGLEPAGMSHVVRQMNSIGAATIRAKLYDLGPYPGVVLEDVATVRGQVLHVPSDDLWRALDEYEACTLPDSPDGLFRRVLTDALREDGRSVRCWVYVYNRDLTRATLVETGCWLTHRRLRPTIKPS